MFPIGAVALDSMQAACPVHRPAVGRSRPRDSVVSAALPSNAAMLHTMTDESRRQRCEDKADWPLTRAAYCSWALMPGRSSSRASFARGRQSASSSRGEPGRSSSRTTQPESPCLVVGPDCLRGNLLDLAVIALPLLRPLRPLRPVTLLSVLRAMLETCG